MNRRPAGHGTVEPLRSGRFRARVPLADGKRHTVGTFDSEDEAEAMIAAFVERAAQENLAPVGGLTVRAMVRLHLDACELDGYTAMPNLRSIARRWVETAPFADWPLRRVTRFTLEARVRSVSREVGESYTAQVVSLFRGMFARALDTQRIDDNPAERLKAPKAKSRTDEPWTFLNPEEQSALLAVAEIPTFWRYAIELSMLTGLRAGELFSLRLADLHAVDSNPRIVVRYGSRRRAPKSGKIREVPLTPRGLAAAREWLSLMPACAPKNPERLVFPSERGGFVKVSRVPGWSAWLRAAGIERRVRWHDLRHTCGASLVSGWWGRAWTLVEVRDLLGHHSVKMTERYAHLGATALKAAAAGTGGGGFGGPRVVHTAAQVQEIASSGVIPRHPPSDTSKVAESHGNSKAVGAAWTSAEALALRLVRAAAAGEGCAELVRLLGAAVLTAAPVTLATAALAGGPHALDRALELAALLLPVAGTDLEADVG